MCNVFLRHHHHPLANICFVFAFAFAFAFVLFLHLWRWSKLVEVEEEDPLEAPVNALQRTCEELIEYMDDFDINKAVAAAKVVRATREVFLLSSVLSLSLSLCFFLSFFLFSFHLSALVCVCCTHARVWSRVCVCVWLISLSLSRAHTHCAESCAYCS